MEEYASFAGGLISLNADLVDQDKKEIVFRVCEELVEAFAYYEVDLTRPLYVLVSTAVPDAENTKWGDHGSCTVTPEVAALFPRLRVGQKVSLINLYSANTRTAEGLEATTRHELIHYIQHFTGMMDVWEAEGFTKDTPYKEQPWEAEAFENEEFDLHNVVAQYYDGPLELV